MNKQPANPLPASPHELRTISPYPAQGIDITIGVNDQYIEASGRDAYMLLFLLSDTITLMQDSSAQNRQYRIIFGPEQGQRAKQLIDLLAVMIDSQPRWTQLQLIDNE